MGSKAQSGLGYVFSVGAPTPVSGIPGADTYIPINDLMEAPIKIGEWQTQAATNFQSSTIEKVPTIQDVGSVSVKGNRNSSDPGQAICMVANATALPYDFKAVFPINKKAGQTSQGDSYVFSAYVLSFQINAITPAGLITFDMNIEMIGTPIYTQGN